MANGYLKASEVAERLNTHITTIYEMCREGELPSIKVGTKAVRIPEAAFEAYLVRREQASPARKLLEEARRGDGELITVVEEQHRRFYDTTGFTAHGFVKRWKDGAVEDTAANSSLLIEALSLREALDRAGIGEKVLA
jgi:excisionase family DNA binding protein